ncbi:hypothetical protein CK3_07140 [butyrate-producing bacterium SS3/4]|nr:hypothetical protein CK3_07140 [butyrate-producing bacterium SS3/4]
MTIFLFDNSLLYYNIIGNEIQQAKM